MRNQRQNDFHNSSQMTLPNETSQGGWNRRDDDCDQYEESILDQTRRFCRGPQNGDGSRKLADMNKIINLVQPWKLENPWDEKTLLILFTTENCVGNARD